jgi:transcriptional regulator with XRE-family HTH domain
LRKSTKQRGSRTPLDLDTLRRDVDTGKTIEELAAARNLDPAVMADILNRLGIARRDTGPQLWPPEWAADLHAAVLEARRTAGLTKEAMSARIGHHHLTASQLEENFFRATIGSLVRYLNALGLRLVLTQEKSSEDEQPSRQPQGREVLPIGWVSRIANPEWTNTIMDALKKQKTKQGLTQARVADAMGVHQGTVSRLEKDYPHVRASALFAYAEALGLRLTVAPGNNETRKHP